MGSIHAYTTASGSRLYRIAYRRPDHSQTNERGFRTKRAAELRLAEVELSKHRGDYVDPSEARITVGMIGASWIDSRSGDLKPSTRRTIQSAWRIHVEPKWGDRQIGSIRHSEIQIWVAALSKTHSATTVRRCHEVLASVLEVAVRDRRLARNVARDIKLPRKVGKERAYLSHAQVAQLAAIAKHPDLVAFLAYTGLRWGEATALRIKHVDTVRRRVRVEENAVEVGSQVIIGTPKTHEKRQVRYPAFLAPTIEHLVATRPRDALLFGDGDHFIRRAKSTTGWFNSAVMQIVRETQERIDAATGMEERPPESFPRVTPHDLRHTAASLAISAGANVKAVQRMLGHASAAMTLDTYADLFDDDLDNVANALDRAAESTGIKDVLNAS
ncbi:tyrosine-type recombinase/integrase [Microbacterium oleivorans]|uniref:tyrosine-type recombinase/integrase n=1 Tax=Microbacterium oleivorans TaxID=273677 RepID=UPI000767264A|nr:tyrosine-type recombinase/integrase [Microbacterium oleivorans]